MQDHAEARDCEALAHLGAKQQAMDLACHQVGRGSCSPGYQLYQSKWNGGAEALVHVDIYYMLQNKNCYPPVIFVLINKYTPDYLSVGVVGLFLKPSHPTEFPGDSPKSNTSLPRCSLVQWGCAILLDVPSQIFSLFPFLLIFSKCQWFTTYICINSVCLHIWWCTVMYVFYNQYT